MEAVPGLGQSCRFGVRESAFLSFSFPMCKINITDQMNPMVSHDAMDSYSVIWENSPIVVGHHAKVFWPLQRKEDMC